MSDHTQRRGLRPRTMSFVARRRLPGNTEFNFLEGDLVLTARQTRQGFFWDADTPDPVANQASFTQPPSPPESALSSKPESDKPVDEVQESPKRYPGISEAANDEDLRNMIGLLGRAYRKVGNR